MELQELLDQIDIVDYISQFVDLTEKGGEFWGLSPFKDEKTPSFSVRRETGRFYDFSSGIGGTALTFVKHFFHCSGREAIEKLTAYLHLDGVEVRPSDKLDAAKVCRKFTPQRSAQKVNKTRVLQSSFMQKYEKDMNKLETWKREGISDEALETFEVYYDPFSNRIVYPIKNSEGQIVNIGGRTLDPDFKAKGERKYTYFYQWGTMNIIYGLFENHDDILRNREIILFEGAKSVLLAHTWGIRNTGALLTSHLSVNQLKILVKLGVPVTFALDKDVDISKDRNIQKLKRYCNVFLLRDTDGALNDKDAPVDQGMEVFKKLYETKERYR